MPQYFKNQGWFATGVGTTFHPNSPPKFDQPYSWSNSTSKLPYYYPKPSKCPTSGPIVWCSVPDNTQGEEAYFEDEQILTETKRL